ncbi:GNAT family N-acetyltransferase [Jatrophihabitans sp. GAS493]|uniref:GNAT family N-acetyltransferase n=1 Tax=Jatrophihabitans sp. GAS493 TaxID=1907575 RepID=UPI000BB71035|nr:GNAT family N-acetyltransferase [Jatrophihabitans sp. GAS493]
MQIRRAVVADALGIAELHVKSWQVGYLGLIPQTYLDGLEPQQRLLRWQTSTEEASWPDRGVLVAEDDGGVIVGFANLCPTRDPDARADTGVGVGAGSIGEITSFYVLPSTWRQGIGRRLMTASVEMLAYAGYAEATLWVTEGNDRAIDFYSALGWVPDGAVKDDVVAGAAIRDLRYRHALR